MRTFSRLLRFFLSPNRSRFIREECALNLMSQVRPFKLECDRRAMRALTRSSPELRSTEKSGRYCLSNRFRAKPVPKHLFSTDVYDRMLEDEYFRYMINNILFYFIYFISLYLIHRQMFFLVIQFWCYRVKNWSITAKQ